MSIYLDNNLHFSFNYSLANTKILIIDDDEGLCDSIKFFFEDHDCEVYAGYTGETGLQLFEIHKPDVVLVDLNMPGMDGHNVVAHVSRNYPDVPIIVVSGTGIIKEAIRSIKLGAWDFVNKPILNFEDLELSVLRALEKAFLIKENKLYKENLEKLVEERTFQLNKKSAELQTLLMDYKIAREKAEESNRLKTAFLNNMSHEIRTPLNVIQGFAQLLKDDFEDNRSIVDLTDPILNNTKQLLQIMEDILSVSFIETGNVKPNIILTNIREIIGAIQHEFIARAKRKGIEFNMSLPEEVCESSFFTDPAMLRQILMKLLDNAINYTSRGYIKLIIEKDGDHMKFIVEDTGIGIAEENLTKIFERFHRVEKYSDGRYNSTTHGGTGLGLSICKGWINLLGGKIWLDSVLGKGTTFYFTIPVRHSN